MIDKMEKEENSPKEFIVLPIVEVKDSPEVKPQSFRLKLSQLFHQIKWSNVIILLVLHVLAVVGYVHCLTHPVKITTALFAVLLAACSGMGMSVGAHRLWAHRSFKVRCRKVLKNPTQTLLGLSSV